MKNLIFSILLFAISNYIIQAQDLTFGLQVNDLSEKPMQPLAKPGYLQTVTDPSFGTTIRRITDAGAGNTIAPMYSTIQAWNADESLMILYQRGQGHILLDGISYQFIRNLDDINPDDIEEIFWDFNNPDILYYLDKDTNEFISYAVSSQTKTTIVDLDVVVTNCSGSFSMGNDVQMMSWDSDVFCFRCNNDRAYYYRISTANLVEFNIADIAFTAPMPAPSGNYFYHGTNIYNAQGNLHLSLNESSTEHSCIGKLANGNDAYITVAFAEGPNGGCIGDAVAHNMQTGNCFTVTSENQGYDYPQSGTHISALAHKNSQNGWFAASMIGTEEDGQSLLDQELIIARADENNIQVCRIGHHRSDEDEANLGIEVAGDNYFGAPHAVISPTGTRVLFGSDWSGPEDGQSIDAYVVELPSYQPPLENQNAVIPGNIKIDPTFEHIAILYNVDGDENLNSELQIEFREQGNGAYKNGAITMRAHPGLVIDGATFNANHHAGSAMFLSPNTTYDIRLTLTDPDGGGTTTIVEATTKAYPTETNNFSYVAPGNSGGNGTSGNPYLGLQTAADNAQPGTTFIVRPGTYTSFNIATDGTANAPITFRSETTHAAIVDGGNTNSGIIILGNNDADSLQHIIIDGLKIQNGNYGIDAQHTQYLTIKNCWIEDVVWGIYNRRENGWEHDQYITNNYISGRTAWPAGGTEHRGVDIRGNRNVVSFNTIKNFDDGISTDGEPYAVSYALDIHNNDIQNMADDLIEVDGTISNTRVYRNRMYNGRAGVSLAPVFGGPCYVFRNEMYNMAEGFSAYKMNRGPSGLVIVHNSSSKLGNGMSSPAGWQNTFFKNNVVIGTNYVFEEFGLVAGSIDDWDYNAYLSTFAAAGAEWFKWDDVRYTTIEDLQNGTNIETNGIALNLNNDIGTPPAIYEVEYSPDDTDFQPSNSSVFRNNGIDLDNLNDAYVTDGQPDRGAYEFGETLPIFGANFNVEETCTPTFNPCNNVNVLDFSENGYTWGEDNLSGSYIVGEQTFDININDPQGIFGALQIDPEDMDDIGSYENNTGIALGINPDNSTQTIEMIYNLSLVSDYVAFTIRDLDYKFNFGNSKQKEKVCVYGYLDGQEVLPTITSYCGSVVVDGNCATATTDSFQSGEDESIRVVFETCINEIKIVYGNAAFKVNDPTYSKIYIADDIGFGTAVCSNACGSCTAEASVISLTGNSIDTFCINDDAIELVEVEITGGIGENAAWVITDESTNILALPAAPPFVFDGLGEGTCLIWQLNWDGELSGTPEVGANAAAIVADSDCAQLSNSIPITKESCCTAVASVITLEEGFSNTICIVDDALEFVEVEVTGVGGENSAWVITDESANILDLPNAPPFRLDEFGTGTCLIWYLNWNGDLGATLEVGANATAIVANSDCAQLSNSIPITKEACCTAVASEIALIGTDDTICIDDNIEKPIDVSVVSFGNGNSSAWVVTDESANILALPDAPPFILDGIFSGTCLIWYLTWDRDLEGVLAIGANATTIVDDSDCAALSNSIPIVHENCFIQQGIVAPTICNGGMLAEAPKVNSVFNNSAIIQWAPQTDASLQYKAVDANQWISVTQSSSYVIIPNLATCKAYEARVNYTCGNNRLTSVKQQFTTEGCVSCDNINTELVPLNVTDNSAIFSWDAVPGSMYTIHYRADYATDWNTYNSTVPFVVLFGLDECSMYEFGLKVTCSNERTSDMSPIVQFGTDCDGEKYGSLAIADNSLLNIYPNPASSFVDISLTKNATISTVEIYNVNGKLLFDKNNLNFNGMKYTAKLNDLPNGIYFITALVEGKVHTKKFLKE